MSGGEVGRTEVEIGVGTVNVRLPCWLCDVWINPDDDRVVVVPDGNESAVDCLHLECAEALAVTLANVLNPSAGEAQPRVLDFRRPPPTQG